LHARYPIPYSWSSVPPLGSHLSERNRVKETHA
jgi:hypothetical protein